MPDVPQHTDDVLRAAGTRAGGVAGHLSALVVDLGRPRPAVLSDADRMAGVAALDDAAEALRAVADAVRAGRPGDGEGAEDVKHA